MKRAIHIFIFISFLAAACTKTEPTRTSGKDTIDNTTYQATTYYYYGFSFSTAALVPTNVNPGPDIVVYVNKDNTPFRLTLQANNLNPSFFKYGEYADEATAIAAFDNLKSFTATQWTEMADPVKPNQIWIYRSGSEKYTKIRIVSTINEMRQLIAYGECTFQWVHQPDGTLTFP